ncbi:MAG: hypothetical protein ACK5BN_23795 [Planctomycetota bacterium]
MSDDDDDPQRPPREALWQRLAAGFVAALIAVVGAQPTAIA